MAEAPKTHHTPRERVVLAYKGGFADRVPAYPIAGSFAEIGRASCRERV